MSFTNGYIFADVLNVWADAIGITGSYLLDHIQEFAIMFCIIFLCYIWIKEAKVRSEHNI
jgi:hypothetical protein